MTMVQTPLRTRFREKFRRLTRDSVEDRDLVSETSDSSQERVHLSRGTAPHLYNAVPLGGTRRRPSWAQTGDGPSGEPLVRQTPPTKEPGKVSSHNFPISFGRRESVVEGRLLQSPHSSAKE